MRTSLLNKRIETHRAALEAAGIPIPDWPAQQSPENPRSQRSAAMEHLEAWLEQRAPTRETAEQLRAAYPIPTRPRVFSTLLGILGSRRPRPKTLVITRSRSDRSKPPVWIIEKKPSHPVT